MRVTTWDGVAMVVLVVIMLLILGVAGAVLMHAADQARNENDG